MTHVVGIDVVRAIGLTKATLIERDHAIVFEPSRSVLPSFSLSVPGDPSSAAFLVGAAVLAHAGELVIENVGVNPTRTGFLDVL